MAYRAYFAFVRNPLRNSKGENTSAAFGFANALLRLHREEKPDYWACVFDTPHPTFRHELYAEYKSTRAKMPEDMAEQLPRVKQLSRAMGCPIIELPGYEADDVIATLAVQAEARGMDVVMVTGDKDFMQLVTDRITIYNSRRKGGVEQIERLNPAGVEEKFGVPPERVVDVLGLAGDSSDNVPGVPGVGPKTAVSLVRKFGDLETVLKNHGKAPGKKLRERLEKFADQARLSLELVTIKTDVPVELRPADLVVGRVDCDEALILLKELEFTNLVRTLLSEKTEELTPPAPRADRGKYQTVGSLAVLKKLVRQWKQAPLLAVDTETTSLDTIQAELVGISISAKSGEAYYIPVGHTDTDENLNREAVLKILRPLLESEKLALTGQNIKYDYQIFLNYGITLGGISFDPMLASYLIDPTARHHDLGSLAQRHCGYEMQPITELIGAGKKQRSFAEVEVSLATQYAAEDADFAFRLTEILKPQLKPMGLDTLYEKIELPLVSVLAEMEHCGVAVDIPYLKRLSRAWEKRLAALTEDIYHEAGEEFNINSPKQLGAILFDKLKLQSVRKTAKTAQRATDVSTLERLASEHPLPALILEYRGVTKLKSTYADALVALVNARTGRVHTSFNQAVAATGRLSSSDPNLQNIPVRTEDGRKIRKAFIAGGEENVLLMADYSQVELRLMAHFSGDEALCEAFARGEDIHTRTASDIFGVPVEIVEPEHRRWAKSANFGIIYGLSAYGLAQQTDMTVREASDFIETYFKRYPGVRRYIDTTIENARRDGYVTTLMGRRRPLPEIRSTNRQRREFAERTAVNTPLQGTAADIIKKAMIDIAAELRGKESRMVLQVHDELVFDAKQTELDWLIEMVREKMEQAVELRVPLKIDYGVGKNWLDAK